MEPMRLLVTDAAAQPPRQATAWLIMTLGRKTMKHAQDHFSAIAPQYSRGRIAYPKELYTFLAKQCNGSDVAWDCATGNGQAALDLAQLFNRVIATDISKELLALAPPHPRIVYREAPAEASGIESKSIDLITVAQALHWFDLPCFWPEVDRVLKDDAIFAFWGYNWPIVQPEVDRILERFRSLISAYWPERSVVLHDGYSVVSPPLASVSTPVLEATAQWDLDDYIAHLSSWSAVRYFKERTDEDITIKFQPVFAAAWQGNRLTIRWPLILRAYKKTEPNK